MAHADRYARQLVLPEVGIAGQRRLAEARVVVVGCGGLGAPVIAQLAAAGVGHLTLVDDDVVEASNLNRQTLFGTADLGARKAVAAAAFVARLDASLEVTPRVERLTGVNARARIREHDVVVDCADGLPTKYLLNDACVREDRPLVHGAATAWSGQVLVVVGTAGPCLRCLFPVLPSRDVVPTCRTAGILAPVVGVVGSLQAAAVLRLLLGVGKNEGGRFVAVDVKEGSTKTLRFERDPACPACGDTPSLSADDDADYFMPPTCEPFSEDMP
ncbi:MAG: HesA/MoeB/ThiF family protein [Deltaproteobacteria bacterium]|nr:HesA/MoeB/ThiF family protein [Deltaproteobacteria bacterium]